MGTILLFLFSFRSQAFGHQVDRCHGSWGYLLTCMVMMLVSGMGMFTLVMTMVVMLRLILVLLGFAATMN